ncbi:hypothetical protein [Paraneptunicella aestuarii]|nr:hypothetical protein [Paraneptunicella aestuarii]
MQHEEQSQAPHDPFNFTYFFIAVAVLLAMPLMHVILGWLTFYL